MPKENAIELARKAGYVQGVCECAAIIGGGETAKNLLNVMGVTKSLAKKYAGPETYAVLESGVFGPKHGKSVNGRK